MKTHAILLPLLLSSSPSLAEVPVEVPAGTVQTLVLAPGQALRLPSPVAGGTLEAALNGGPLRRTQGITAPQSGTHWLSILTRDPAGNPSAVHWVGLQIQTAETATQPPDDTAAAASAGRDTPEGTQ